MNHKPIVLDLDGPDPERVIAAYVQAKDELRATRAATMGDVSGWEWLAMRKKLWARFVVAGNALVEFIGEHGPVHTEWGYWYLSEEGRLLFKRTLMPVVVWEGQCLN